MKDLKLILIPLILLVFSALISTSNNSYLKAGDIAFTSYKAAGASEFSIICLKDIPSNSIIYFTDSEWNGNHFGADENSLKWNSGDYVLKAGTQVIFKELNSNGKCDAGYISGKLKLSKKKDAIFAFSGTDHKQPTKFIAAVSNHENGYGTLINTGLIEGYTAITYPNGTYFSELKKELLLVYKDQMLIHLNDMDNYSIETKKSFESINRIVNSTNFY